MTHNDAEKTSEESQSKNEEQGFFEEIISKLPASFVSVILMFVALGNFNDSFEVINRFYEFGRSLFSNQVYYEKIANVKVGLNARYLENDLGEPQLIKRVGDNVDANYYFEDDFILVVFEADSRVEAYYVMSFNSSFQPNINLDNDNVKPLWTTAFDMITPSTDYLAYDFSKNNSFYLESTPVLSNGMSVNIYLGWSSVANQSINKDLYADLEKINELDLLGDEQLIEQIMVFRATYAPNFFGYGNVDVDAIQQSFLTNSELLFYAGIS